MTVLSCETVVVDHIRPFLRDNNNSHYLLSGLVFQLWTCIILFSFISFISFNVLIKIVSELEIPIKILLSEVNMVFIGWTLRHSQLAYNLGHGLVTLRFGFLSEC